MCKIKTIILCIAACLVLVFMGSCNLPSLFPGDGSTTPGDDSPVDVEPTAPANTDGAETVRIPGGTFTMGSADSDTFAADDEKPVHQVTVGTFYLYTHEVTNEMYQACVDAGVCLPINVMDSGPTTHTADPAYANYPVVGVDWNMARDYCTWAGARLPTEAEWEYAARGTESLLHPWGGEDAGCDRVNMLGCAVPPDVVEVGSYLLGNSPFEVWDMAGNVWEWVQDWYGEDYYTFSPGVNPLGPGAPANVNDPLKVVRGGGLYSAPEQMRSADRAAANPYHPYDDVGFRCVAEGALPTGDDYTETFDRHDWVPPDPLDGGGEPLDDPDHPELLRIGFGIASCPTPDGRIHIVIEVSSDEELEYSVSVEGIPFDCYYDDWLHILHCEGPAPDTTETPGIYHAEVSFGAGGVLDHVFHRMIPIPEDCPFPPPDRYGVDMSCPRDGLFTISFFYDPPIHWDSVRLRGMDVPCVEISDYEIRCTAPDFPMGDHYEFYLHGYGVSGGEYIWLPWVPLLEGCPVDFLDISLTPVCSESIPDESFVGISWTPDSLAIESVSAGGTLLDCYDPALGFQMCIYPPGFPLGPVDVTVCMDGGACVTESTTVPDCSMPGEAITHIIEPYCYPPEAPAPSASIHYWPSTHHLTSVTAGGASILCMDWGGGWYICPGVPGAAGESVDVTACLADGTCFTDPLVIPSCAESGEDWRMAAIGCVDETNIYFIVDTYMDWLVPGAAYTYSAWDDETGYTCSVHPTISGRLYCAGARPSSPGTLQVCLQQDGAASPTCSYFTDYATWVAGVPSCAPEEPPPDKPHTPHCIDYTDMATCNSHGSDGCKWSVTYCAGP